MLYLKTDILRPITYISSGKFIAEDIWMHAERTLDSYEILICIIGKIFIQQADRKYVLNPGDSILLFPGQTHKGYDWSDKGTQAYWMHFYCNDPTYLLEDEAATAEYNQLKINPYYSGLINSILIPECYRNLNMDRISILFNQLIHLAQSKNYSRLGSNYILTSILIELTEQNVEYLNKFKHENLGDEKLNAILEWIRLHYHQNISLHAVALEFNYSKEYLARYFKKKMGMNMQQYINNLKLSKAKELLCNSDLSIKEISYSLGFADEKYFMKLFKKAEMITPKSFRSAYYMRRFSN